MEEVREKGREDLGIRVLMTRESSDHVVRVRVIKREHDDLDPVFRVKKLETDCDIHQRERERERERDRERERQRDRYRERDRERDRDR